MRTGWSIGAGLLATVIPLLASGQVGSGTAQTTSTTPHSIPFSMSQTLTRVQTLASGTTITHTDVIRTLRDSEGRTRTERESNWGYETVSREAGVAYLQPRGGKVVQITVLDPVKSVTMNWQEGGPSKVVSVNHTRQSRPPAGSYTPRPVVPKEGPRAVMRSEDLGVKNIQGVYAKGSRTTTTYPAGFDGNSSEYSVSIEYWASSDLNGFMVEERREGGPEGKMTTTLTSFKEGEQDPAVFKAPEGYIVWDQQTPDAAPASP